MYGMHRLVRAIRTPPAVLLCVGNCPRGDKGMLEPFIGCMFRRVEVTKAPGTGLVHRDVSHGEVLTRPCTAME